MKYLVPAPHPAVTAASANPLARILAALQDWSRYRALLQQ